MILIAGISIAIFFELLLIFKKNKSRSDKVLIIWMFLIAFHLFLFFLNYTKLNFSYPFLLGIELPLPLLHGVMLFWYVASSTNHKVWNKNIIYLHFIPALVAYLYLIHFFALPADQKIYIFKNDGLGNEVFLSILYYSYSVLSSVYIIWSIILLRQHKKNIVNQYSVLEKVNLNWLRILIGGMGLIWFVTNFLHNEIYNFSSVVIFVFLIGFFGIRQIGITPLNQEESDLKNKKVKYFKSGLKKEQSKELYQKLRHLMEIEKMFTQNDLLITDLASILQVHHNHLSQVINELEGKNFYEFVNHYRIEEFKRLVSSPNNRQFTLLSLAFECGFNSKSSFNRYFKKSTGQTPSQYFTQLT